MFLVFFDYKLFPHQEEEDKAKIQKELSILTDRHLEENLKRGDGETLA